MRPVEIPLQVLLNFKQHRTTALNSSVPQEWFGQFVDYGLMYWQDADRMELTGLGEEILEEERRDRERGYWEPFAASGISPPSTQ